MEGPVRTGKTRALLERSYILATKHPKSRQLWLRKTRISMNESVLQTFEDHVLPQGHYLLHKASRGHRQKYVFRNGAEVILGGMDEPTRILSTEFDIIVVFEATEIELDEWETLITRASNMGMPYRQILADCNPAHPGHWLNERFKITPKTSSRFRLLSRLEDNPKFYSEQLSDWTREGRELIAKLETLTGPRYLRLRKGIWSAIEGMIYDTWDKAVFVTDDKFEPETVIAGVDKGFPNPSCILPIGINADGKVRVLTEFYKPSVLAVDLVKEAERLAELYDIELFMVDPSCAELIQQLNVAGLPAKKANNNVQAGIDCVASYLTILADSKPWLSIAPQATNTCSEFTGYRWKEKSVKEEPVKENDHAMDALRYGMMEVARRQTVSAAILDLDAKEVKPHTSDILTSIGATADEMEGIWDE